MIKFEVSKLKEAIDVCVRTVGRDSGKVKPILGYAKAEINGTAKISATCFDAGASVECACDSPSSVTLLLPLAKMAAICGMSSGDLTIEETGSGLRVKSGSASWKLDTESPRDFPPVEFHKPHAEFNAPPAMLADAMLAATVATDPESSRWALAAIHFLGNDKSLVVEGTDGRRGVLSTLPIAVSCDALLGGKFATSAAQVIRKWPQCRVEISHSNVTFTDGDQRITFRQTDGRFPRLGEFLPDLNRASFSSVISTDETLAALRAVNLTIDYGNEDEKYCYGVTLEVANNCLTFSHLETVSRVQLRGDFPSGKLIMLDAQFLAEAIGTCKSETTIHVIDSTCGLSLTSGNLRWVIQPMELKNPTKGT